ncbi:uncharacterized protein PG998_000266 [Apiospora kogelbergensis]|uniref:uncharacterized protein n=1 Tax=Apiospora kogelbergensis TaxID=1337665 RepID=UPI00312E79EA
MIYIQPTNTAIPNSFNHYQPPNFTNHVSALPSPVKPSAIALGTVFNHGVELAVMTPLFGETYRRAKIANSSEEFVKSKEASSAAVAWGTSLVGSALQAYGVGALINATGTLSYKGATYLGALIYMATAAPTYLTQLLSEKRPVDTVAVSATAKAFETVGLSLFLTWWGTRTNPFN